MTSLKFALVLLCLTITSAVWAEDFRAAMEENNSRWLQAYNNQDAEVLGSMYAHDATLIAAGSQPIRGAKEIEA